MYCPNCKQSYEGKFCPECGTKLIENPTNEGFHIKFGDANAISGGLNLTDSHDVTNIDNSIHNTTNNTTTVNNFQPEVFGANDVNVQELLEKAVDYYDDENYFKAIQIFNQISDKDVEASYYLGECYREGNGVLQDYDTAINWYTKAAAQGFPDAQYELGCMLVEEEYGRQNIEEGIKYLNMAALQGLSDAIFYMGALYLLGKNVEKDNEQAFFYFSKMKKDTSDALPYGYALSCFEKDSMTACKILNDAREPNYYDIEEMTTMEKEVVIKGCLLYANILCNNINGYGKYDLGIKYYKWLIAHFGCGEAQEKLDQIRNSGSCFRNYGDYHSDGNGNYIVNEGVTTLLKKSKFGGNINFIPTDAISVVIPSSVTTIGEGAFQGYEYLEKVILPDSLKTIENYAFDDCRKLKNISIPNTVISIGENTFDASGIEDIIIPDSVEIIKKEAFYFCENLRKITLPSGLKKIEEGTFNSSGIEEIIIPDSVEIIEKEAFYSCKNLRKITLPSGLKKIEEGTFKLSGIEEIIIPDSVEIIEKEAFSRCENLRKITLPSGLKKIEEQAFYSASFKEVLIPEGVEYIGNEAFYTSGCIRVYLPSTIKTFVGKKIFGSVEEVIIAQGIDANVDPEELFYKTTKISYTNGSDISLVNSCVSQTTVLENAKPSTISTQSTQSTTQNISNTIDETLQKHVEAFRQHVDDNKQKLDEMTKEISKFALKFTSWFNKFK